MGGVKNSAQESEEGSTPHPRNYSLSLKKRACCKIQHTLVVILIDMEMIICGIFTVGGNPKTPRYSESGAVTYGVLKEIMKEDSMKREMGIDEDSIILLISTEGDTDPEGYDRILSR